MIGATLITVGCILGICLVLLPYRLDPYIGKHHLFLYCCTTVVLLVGIVVAAIEVFFSKRRHTVVVNAISLIVGVIASLSLLAFYNGAHSWASDKNRCLNNRREIGRIIEKLALDDGSLLTLHSNLVELELSNHISPDSLRCPAGGEYYWHELDSMPDCSIPEHNVD